MRLKQLTVFAGFWLLTGFTLGTFTLLGPVRGMTNVARAREWSEGAEKGLVLVMIGLFVVVSALVAAWLARGFLRTKLTHVRLGLPALALAATLPVIWLWMTPSLMGSSMGEEQTSENSAFTFGPYPSAERLVELEREGFTAVISLLHPAVVPFEPKLIAEEEEAIRGTGLEFIHVPMLPWVSDNEEALSRIEELAATPGRYYVHCYLGQDRVRLVRHIVEQAEGVVEKTVDAAGEVERLLHDALPFERGEVVEAGNGVFLTPYPTDDEFMRFVLTGAHGPVVSLLDPQTPSDQKWIVKEETLCDSHRVGFESKPLATSPVYDAKQALAIARDVAMSGPAVVHHFLGARTGRAPSAEAFLIAFRTNLPPLPPTLFKEKMGQATVRVIAPNVALGPKPAPNQFGIYLARRGIARALYVGTPDNVASDREASRIAGIRWESMAADDVDAIVDKLRNGGPWYLYGDAADRLAPRIAQALGPVIPDTMQWESEVADEEPEPEVVEAGVVPSFAVEGLPADSVTRNDSILPGFLARLMPDARTTILVWPLFAIYAAAAAAFAGWLRSRKAIRTPYTRKIFHFFIFSTAGILQLIGGLPLVALFGGIVALAVLYAVWRGDDFPFYEAMARPTDAPRRSLFILVPLATTAAGGLLSNWFFGAFAVVGYLVAGWGDAMGEPVGTAFGKHRYKVPTLAGVPAWRSLEGSSAVCLVGGLAAVLGLYFAGVELPVALGVGIACGVAGALIEAFSNHGLDNLTIQLAAAGTAWILLG